MIDWSTRTIHLEPDQLRLALDAFERIVGPGQVIGPAGVGELAKATIPDAKLPAGIVYPGSAEEVAAVVRAAAVHGISLWPCSRGRNWGYGSATPAMDNTVVLHLERLNRVLEVHPRLAYAVVEPGVTYRQLREHLEAHHPDLWCDCTDGTPDGSVIGNALERGLGTTHYADHFGTLCGLEVVLASGEIVRTGGGPSNCKTWNTHKWGVGPYLEGLFSQSGFGVVTKAGIWLIPKPEAYLSFTFDLRNAADLPTLIEIIRDLQLHQVVTSAVHVVNDVVSLAVMSQYPAGLPDSCSRLSDALRARMRRQFGIACWSFGGGLLGTADAVRSAKKTLRRRLRGLGRLTFLGDRTIRHVETLARWRTRPLLRSVIDRAARALFAKSPEMLLAAPHIHSVLKGIPSDYFARHAYFKSRKPKPDLAHPDRDDVGLIWFAPIAPMTAEHIAEVNALCEPLFDHHGFDYYVALLVQNARSMVFLTCIFYVKDDASQTSRAQALHAELGAAVARAGYQQYRMSVGDMHTLNASAPEFVALLRRIRGAIDPCHVIAPGKGAV